jgi:hypothetical protein
LDGSTLALRSDLQTPLTDFVLAPDGARLAVGLTGGVVAVYNTGDLSESASFATAIAEPHLQLLPQVDAGGSGQVIVSGDGRAERWQYGEGEGALPTMMNPWPRVRLASARTARYCARSTSRVCSACARCWRETAEGRRWRRRPLLFSG